MISLTCSVTQTHNNTWGGDPTTEHFLYEKSTEKKVWRHFFSFILLVVVFPSALAISIWKELIPLMFEFSFFCFPRTDDTKQRFASYAGKLTLSLLHMHISRVWIYAMQCSILYYMWFAIAQFWFSRQEITVPVFNWFLLSWTKIFYHQTAFVLNIRSKHG